MKEMNGLTTTWPRYMLFDTINISFMDRHAAFGKKEKKKGNLKACMNFIFLKYNE
jgi:hypothetical protein